MRPAPAVAVVGTDTEVGKTVASALLVARYAAEGPLAYWKPVASGAVEDRDTDTVETLSGAPAGAEFLPEAYLLPQPLSPHLAAHLAGEEIEPSRIVGDFRRHRAVEGRALVVEGVGGLLVPFTYGGYLLADLLEELALPVLLVARSTLGTLNHTLLTLEALRARGMRVAGLLLVGPPHQDNRRTLEDLGEVQVLAELPRLDPLNPAAVAAAAAGLDPGGAWWRGLSP